MPRKDTSTLQGAVGSYLAVRATYLASNTLVNDRAVLRAFVKHVGALAGRKLA